MRRWLYHYSVPSLRSRTELGSCPYGTWTGLAYAPTQPFSRFARERNWVRLLYLLHKNGRSSDRLFLCRRWDLNPHGIATTGTWSLRVCQFHHFCSYQERSVRIASTRYSICFTQMCQEGLAALSPDQWFNRAQVYSRIRKANISLCSPDRIQHRKMWYRYLSYHQS